MTFVSLIYWSIILTIALVCVAGAAIELGMAVFRRLTRSRRLHEPDTDLELRRTGRAHAL